MNYNPQTQYRGDQYIFQGGQNMARVMEQLVGYFINRGQQTAQAQAEMETAIGPDGTASGANDATSGAPPGSEGDLTMGGFNPVTGGAQPAGNEETPAMPQRGTMADSLRKYIMAARPDAKDVHQAVKAMSLEQLHGALAGYGMRQAASEHAAKMEDYNAQAALRRQNALDDQTVGRLVQAYGNYPAATDEDGNPLPVAPGERMRYAFTKVPEAGGRALPKAIEALTKYEKLSSPAEAEDLRPGAYTVPGTGAVFAYRGKQFLPAGFDPKVAPQVQAVPQHDEDGNLIGWSQTDMKGRSQFTRFHGNAKFAPATDTQGNPIPGFYVDPNNGKPIDARSTIQKLSGNSPSGSPAAAGPLPIPKNKSDLVKGKQYTLPGRPGAWIWDGTQFLPAK